MLNDRIHTPRTRPSHTQQSHVQNSLGGESRKKPLYVHLSWSHIQLDLGHVFVVLQRYSMMRYIGQFLSAQSNTSMKLVLTTESAERRLLGMSAGPCDCKVSALSLSYVSSIIFKFHLKKNWQPILKFIHFRCAIWIKLQVCY